MRQSVPFRAGRLGPESIREVVFGVEDGLVQNMTLIAGMVGAGVSDVVIVLAGIVNAVAGVLSMSMGTFLSSQAERDALLIAGRGAAVVRSPTRDATVMAGAYGAGALAPLVAFGLPVLGSSAEIVLAVIICGAGLFALGILKARVSGRPSVRSGLELLALASAAGVAGYLIGVVARAVFDITV
jgi:VIT1/CCC1 family predicted Fe2+/Mn2+ transporter